MDKTSELELYKNLLKTIADPFFVIGEDGTYLDVFGGAERTLYDDVHSLKGKNIYNFMEREFADFFMEKVRLSFKINTMHSFEYQLETERVKDVPKNGPGGVQWFEARLVPLPSRYSGQRAVVALLINITERKKLQQILKELSYKDPLTLVGNRRYFFEKLDENIDLYAKDKIPCAVIVIDIDNFKNINDTFGHYVGDQVLKELSSILSFSLGKDDYIARFGGDEFVISLVGYRTSTLVLQWADKVREKVEKHLFRAGESELYITISMGITDMLILDNETTSIVCRADKALYEAKNQGRNRVKILLGYA